MKTRVLNILQLGAAPLALGMALCAGAAQAQQAPAAEDIVVTGTRIRLPNLENPEPTVTIGRDYIETRGLTNLGDVLNESPGVRGSTTPQGLQPTLGVGMNFVNLYGLGVNRTLVLVNGKRQVSSLIPQISGTPGTPVDLNTIPTILVDRVDRVGVGGAPVYGTDAIAGTINLILKRRMKGLDLAATSGITEEGDNYRLNLSAVGGVDFAGGRGNITAAVGYDRSDGVTYNDRWFLRANVINVSNPSSATAAALGPVGRTAQNDGRVNPAIGFNDSLADGFPATILVANVTRPAVSTNGVIASSSGTTSAYNWQFNSSGALVAYNRGIPYVSPVSATVGSSLNGSARASGGDGYKLNDYNQVVAGVRRLNSALFASYDLTDRITLKFDGSWSHSRTDQMAAQPTLNATISSGRSGALTFSVNNPFLSPQTKQQLAALGYTSEFTLSRANTDLTDPTGHTDSDVYRGVLGAEGKFALGGRDYAFEVYADYGRADVADYYQDLDHQKFINAINVAEVNGQIVCSTTPSVKINASGTTSVYTAPVADAACQPLNLFGSGTASKAALAYIQRNTVTRSRLEQFVANANLGGAPFDLNGNPVSFNLGVEHHREYGRFVPDAFLQQGLGRQSPIAPVSGKFHLTEEFAEVLVPLVTPDNGWPVSRLQAFGRVRHVDSSLAHGDFTAWSAGGAFAPVKDVEFRGNITRSFRAPSITELYSARASSGVTVDKLCDTPNGGPAPAVRAANCAAFVAKYGATAGLSGGAAYAYAGGNPNLRNERADSFTWGVIVRPSFVPGLSVAVDYINIKIKDPIAFQSIAAIASGCFDNPTFDAADPANGNVYCSLIRRDASGQVINDPNNPSVTTGYVNGQRIFLDAVQATIDYTTALDRIGISGALGLGADLFFLRNRLNDVTGVSPTQSEGTLGDPKFQGQFRLRYAAPAWGLGTNVNVTGAQALAYTQRAASPNDVREFDHFNAFATVDTSLWLNAADRFRLTLSVTNLFDRIGQFYNGYYVPGSNSTFGSINDALGRRFTVSVRKNY